MKLDLLTQASHLSEMLWLWKCLRHVNKIATSHNTYLYLCTKLISPAEFLTHLQMRIVYFEFVYYNICTAVVLPACSCLEWYILVIWWFYETMPCLFTVCYIMAKCILTRKLACMAYNLKVLNVLVTADCSFNIFKLFFSHIAEVSLPLGRYIRNHASNWQIIPHVKLHQVHQASHENYIHFFVFLSL